MESSAKTIADRIHPAKKTLAPYIKYVEISAKPSCSKKNSE
jgi:hypothetical protein